MFCPNCGSTNQAEVTFCTRCGTNLGVVSDALSGKISQNSQTDEHMVTVLKNYYRGQRSAAIGGAALLVAALKLAIFALLGFNQGSFPIAQILAVYGIFAIVLGLTRWNRAASEMKAIEHVSSRGALSTGDSRSALPSGQAEEPTTNALSTDPLSFPGSVTENTTRHLEESNYESETENHSTQTE